MLHTLAKINLGHARLVFDKSARDIDLPVEFGKGPAVLHANDSILTRRLLPTYSGVKDRLCFRKHWTSDSLMLWAHAWHSFCPEQIWTWELCGHGHARINGMPVEQTNIASLVPNGGKRHIEYFSQLIHEFMFRFNVSDAMCSILMHSCTCIINYVTNNYL